MAKIQQEAARLGDVATPAFLSKGVSAPSPRSSLDGKGKPRSSFDGAYHQGYAVEYGASPVSPVSAREVASAPISRTSFDGKGKPRSSFDGAYHQGYAGEYGPGPMSPVSSPASGPVEKRMAKTQ